MSNPCSIGSGNGPNRASDSSASSPASRTPCIAPASPLRLRSMVERTSETANINDATTRMMVRAVDAGRSSSGSSAIAKTPMTAATSRQSVDDSSASDIGLSPTRPLMNPTTFAAAMDFSVGDDARPRPKPRSEPSDILGAAVKPTRGWLLTAVAPWGESEEDAFDQCLVELGLGDARIVVVQGAMLPLGFEADSPESLPMGSLVECHMAVARAWSGASACAAAAWAQCETPEGEECAIVATMSSEADSEETELLLKRVIQRKLASRDLEVISHDVAVDEVTAGDGHWGTAIAALIMPNSLGGIGGPTGRAREISRPSPTGGIRSSDSSSASDFSM